MTLQELRRAKDLSQREAAKALGIEARRLCDFEFGRVIPAPEEITAMAELYRVTAETVQQSLPDKETTERKEQFRRAIEAMVAAKEDAKQKGLCRGNGGRSSLPCPTGCGGDLHYSVASINGHMWARCSTKGCVSWIE